MCEARRGTRLQALGTPPSASPTPPGPPSCPPEGLLSPSPCRGIPTDSSLMGDSGTAPPQGWHPQKTLWSPHCCDIQESSGGASQARPCPQGTWHRGMVAPTGTRGGDSQPQAGSTACSGTDRAVKKSPNLPSFALNQSNPTLTPSDPVLGHPTPEYGTFLSMEFPGGPGDGERVPRGAFGT